MIQKDYIMRMVEQAAKALNRIMVNKKNDSLDEAQKNVENAFNNVLGIDLQLLLLLSESDAAVLFGISNDKEIGSVKCLMAARLLKEYSEIQSKIENKIQLCGYTKALHYYLYGLLNIGDETLNKNEYLKEMNELLNLRGIEINEDMKLKIDEANKLIKND